MLAGRADVDHQGEDRLHDRVAGRGVLPVGLGDVELELAAVGSFLLVDVADDGRALEDVADLGPALVLERLLPVEDGAAGSAQAVDKEVKGKLVKIDADAKTLSTGVKPSLWAEPVVVQVIIKNGPVSSGPVDFEFAPIARSSTRRK